MTTYTLGAVEQTIKNISDRIASHMVAGQRLSTVKQLLQGHRKIDDGGNELLPAIIIEPRNFAAASTTQALNQGEDTMTITVDIRLVVSKLMSATTTSMATNILFDSSGAGVLALYQNLIYAMSHTTEGVNVPLLGLKLDKKPMCIATLEQTDITYEMIINYEFAVRYIYDKICGITT